MEGCSFAVFVSTALTLRTLTLKDHLKSKKHAAKMEVRKAKNSPFDALSTSRQKALMIGRGCKVKGFASRVCP